MEAFAPEPGGQALQTGDCLLCLVDVGAQLVGPVGKRLPANVPERPVLCRRDRLDEGFAQLGFFGEAIFCRQQREAAILLDDGQKQRARTDQKVF